MDIRRWFYLALVSGVLAGLAGMAYQTIYQYLTLTDFSKIANWSAILGASLLGCLLIGMAYALLYHWKKQQWIPWMNILVAALSFLSILGPMQVNLPLDIEFPELFPGLVVPMHFFPALSFLSILPFFSPVRSGVETTH
jgi:hypothetical protein